jgi:hypothetical protein
MILRGREIAYEAANSPPTIPSSMPNYTHDQIRELYGELDKKTRRFQEHDYRLHTSMIDAWKEKSPTYEQCPLPKFRIEKNDQTILMAAYLSTGLSNPRANSHSNEKESIRGSFRTAIADRTTVTPSPLSFNVRLDFPSMSKQFQTQKIIPSVAETSKSMDIDSLTDLDDKTSKESCVEADPLVTQDCFYYGTVPSPIQTTQENSSMENSSMDHLIKIVHDIHFVYDEINEKQSSEILTDDQKEKEIVDTDYDEHAASVTQPFESEENVNIEESDFLFNQETDCHRITSDIDAEFEDLYERYLTNFDQYEALMQQIDQFEPKSDLLSPISEESVTLVEQKDEFSFTVPVKHQANHIGHYGFELEQTSDGKIKISSIIDSNYCPNLNIGDEILSINNHSKLTTLEQCHLLFHTLWYNQHDYVQITVRKPKISSKYISYNIQYYSKIKIVLY